MEDLIEIEKRGLGSRIEMEDRDWNRELRSGSTTGTGIMRSYIGIRIKIGEQD
jgi:hypothetical protein